MDRKIFGALGGKPKLLSAKVKHSQVILGIVLSLLAKALYEFGFFEGML